MPARSRQNQSRFKIVKLLGFAIALLLCASLIGHETDQYTLPDGRQFADRGPGLSRWFYRMIEQGVNQQNAAIKSAIAAHRSPSEIARLQSDDQIIRAVNSQFPYAVGLIEDLDREIDSGALVQKYPGRLPGYRPPFTFKQYMMFPMNPLRAWYAGTILVYGSYVGTDKIGHFTDMGMHYYEAYHNAKAGGASEEKAMDRAIACGTTDPFTSESGMLGFGTAGDYSNGDLVANFSGFLFYRNLVEPMPLHGESRPAMLVRQGQFWSIAPQTRDDPDFFRWFISDHLDEAMNPGLFLSGMRDGLRDTARASAASVLDHRVDANGERHSRRWFEANRRELSTYWGSNYGHRGDKELITIGGDCFAPAPRDIRSRNTQGRTALHCAVANADVARIQQLIQAGADVNAPIRSGNRYSPDEGETALHLAASDGRADIVKILLDGGANVKARSDRGVTPLHRATEDANLIALLIEHSADVNAADAAGRTPLHWAARDGQPAAIAALIDHHANIAARDHEGRTALFDAVASQDVGSVSALLKRGVDPMIADNFHATALHFAAAQRSPAARDVVQALLESSHIDPNARDDFGFTALHAAVRTGYEPVVAALLDAGASPDVADAYGVTPLKLAAGYHDLAELMQSPAAASFRQR